MLMWVNIAYRLGIWRMFTAKRRFRVRAHFNAQVWISLCRTKMLSGAHSLAMRKGLGLAPARRLVLRLVLLSALFSLYSSSGFICVDKRGKNGRMPSSLDSLLLAPRGRSGRTSKKLRIKYLLQYRITLRPVKNRRVRRPILRWRLQVLYRENLFLRPRRHRYLQRWCPAIGHRGWFQIRMTRPCFCGRYREGGRLSRRSPCWIVRTCMRRHRRKLAGNTRGCLSWMLGL